VADYRNDALLWLERELARQLAPVPAPDSLWDRINGRQRMPRPGVSLDWVFWAVAAAMAVLAFAGIERTLVRHRDPGRLTDRDLAALAADSGEFDIRSGNLEETRAWVKAEADIDIDVPAGQPAADRGGVRLLGARLIRLRGLPIAAIGYRVGDDVATLFVSGRHAGLSGSTEVSKHLFSRTTLAGGARLISWNMRSQTYAIAFSGATDPRGACLLCHRAD
jgi:hypothetical protein